MYMCARRKKQDPNRLNRSSTPPITIDETNRDNVTITAVTLLNLINYSVIVPRYRIKATESKVRLVKYSYGI